MLRVSLKQMFTDSSSVTPEFFQQDFLTKRPEQLTHEEFVQLTNMVAEVL